MPSLRYRDVEAAIDWLCEAFGFEEHGVVSEDDGTIRHAQLTLGSDMIMLLPPLPFEADGAAKHPGEGGGAETQSLYFVVDDAEAHYRSAQAAGAEILENGEYTFGGHGYSCRDPEGHIWHFGTYNPRQEESAEGIWIREFLYGNRARGLAERLRDRINPPVLVAGVVAGIVAATTVGWMLLALTQTSASAREGMLAFRALVAPQPSEPGAVRSLARADARTQLNNPPAESASASPARRGEQASERPGQQAAEAARLGSPAFGSIAALQRADAGPDSTVQQIAERTAEEALVRVRTARQAADRSAEEVLSKLRAGQRTAAQAFRQRRAARKAAAAAEPRPAEPRGRVATAAPDAAEQQSARERDAKEAAAKKAAERAGKEARNAAAEAERVKASAAQPAKAPPRAPQEQNADAQGWDCLPSPPSGQIVCHPPAKKPASAKAAAAARPKLFAVETVDEPSQGQKQLPQEQAAGAQFWDCQPSPDGQIVCRPIGGQGARANP